MGSKTAKVSNAAFSAQRSGNASELAADAIARGQTFARWLAHQSMIGLRTMLTMTRTNMGIADWLGRGRHALLLTSTGKAKVSNQLMTLFPTITCCEASAQRAGYRSGCCDDLPPQKSVSAELYRHEGLRVALPFVRTMPRSSVLCMASGFGIHAVTVYAPHHSASLTAFIHAKGGHKANTLMER